MSGIQAGVMLERLLAVIALTAALMLLFRQEALLEQQYHLTAERILCEPVLTQEGKEGHAGIS